MIGCAALCSPRRPRERIAVAAQSLRGAISRDRHPPSLPPSLALVRNRSSIDRGSARASCSTTGADALTVASPTVCGCGSNATRRRRRRRPAAPLSDTIDAPVHQRLTTDDTERKAEGCAARPTPRTHARRGHSGHGRVVSGTRNSGRRHGIRFRTPCVQPVWPHIPRVFHEHPSRSQWLQSIRRLARPARLGGPVECSRPSLSLSLSQASTKEKP